MARVTAQKLTLGAAAYDCPAHNLASPIREWQLSAVIASFCIPERSVSHSLADEKEHTVLTATAPQALRNLIDLGRLRSRSTSVWLSLALLLGVGAAPNTVAASGKNSQPILVELFTSQGCSSCPPADRYLGKLAQNENLVALSYNVDYWDYLGWRDTLAKPAFTQRQKAYARARGDGQIYTPQLVINGDAHSGGANRAKIAKLLTRASATPANAPDISVSDLDGVTRVNVGSVSGPSRKATVWLATIRRKIHTKVKRGENRGRTLAHHNVVRQLIPIGVWMGEERDYQLDVSMLMKEGAEACAIIIQEGEAGPVIATAWIHR